MTSYQKRKNEIQELKEKLSKAQEFERMFKNYIRAINNNKEVEKINYEKWFARHSLDYAKQIGLIK